MPTDRVRVTKVLPMSTRRAGCTQYIIDVETELGWLRQYETVSDFKASLCERAKARNCWIDLVWKDSRYGREIVSVELGQVVA